MRLTPEIHLVGSGRNGLGLSDSFDCNVYLLDGGSDYALIDTGGGYRTEPMLEEIARSGVEPGQIGQILLTHKHGDHAGGAAELQRLTGARVFATAGTAAAVADAETFNNGLARARRAGIYPEDYVFRAVEVTDVIEAGDAIAVGNLELRVIDSPGHCSHHCSFVMESAAGRCLFSGDSLFPGGTVLLQPILDCSIPETVATIEALAGLEIDALMAGHAAPVLSNGDRHVQMALDRIRDGKIPLQLM
jgi:hydroxyacylglutathione hydrolase